jgi:hypothetical protein
MWTWIAVGLGSFLLASSFVGVVFARVLNTLRETSESLETEVWAHIAPRDPATLSGPVG